MKTSRGLSQVVFNFLPDQTFDQGGRVWKVTHWVEPRSLPVDNDVVRAALRRAAHPWSSNASDSGFAEALHRDDLFVIAPTPDGGVRADAFPELWYCRHCKRVSTNIDSACMCGNRQWAQLPFVAYHDCGRLETPWVPTCPHHDQVRVNLPNSSSTTDLRFDCPVCSTPTISNPGFPYRKCPCGQGTLSYNIHRAAVVYTARSTVLVNPPSPAEAAALKTEAGMRQALEWVLGGLKQEKPREEAPSFESLVAILISNGLSAEAANAAAQVAAEKGGSGIPSTPRDFGLRKESYESASEAALLLAYATASGRTSVSELAERAAPSLASRYTSDYPTAIVGAGLESVELLEDFPVLNVSFGYTRGGKAPGETALRWFRTSNGTPRVHGQLSRTEALLFRLDPVRVASWLSRRGHDLEVSPASPEEARIEILRVAAIPQVGDDPSAISPGADVFRLVHTYSHRVMRRISSFSGIDRDSLSEYLIPEHLCFAIYAAANGDFVLGGLQALFEHDLAEAIEDIFKGEHRCALDPGCAAHGGACVACLHVGEPSCRAFNQFLDRRALFGSSGFLS